jgi:phage gpG-like protein
MARTIAATGCWKNEILKRSDAKDFVVLPKRWIVARKARGMIGHEQPYWQGLAAATIADKIRMGFPAPAPLLRTGDLKRSIKVDAPYHNGNETWGFVYSDSPYAKYQELGTSSIPPRPFISLAAMGQQHVIGEMLAAAFLEARFKEWHLTARILGHAWNDAKEAFEEDEADKQ